MEENKDLFPVPVYWGVPQDLAEVADNYAQTAVFATFQQGKAVHTLRRQQHQLRLFARYLCEATGYSVLTGTDLYNNVEAWRNMSYGIVEGYKRWLIWGGYAIGSINIHLNTVRTYCGLAYQAGVLTTDAWTHIRGVKSIGKTEAVHVNEKRTITRIGYKKAHWITLSESDIWRLKQQDDVKKALLACLLLDLGLRCGEIALLTFADFNVFEYTLHVTRPKVNLEQTHTFSPDMRKTEFLHYLALPKGDNPYAIHENVRTLDRWIKDMGEAIGIAKLSAHDCRHTWVTHQIKMGTNLKYIQTAGGWTSPRRVLDYASAAIIANEGIQFRGGSHETKR